MLPNPSDKRNACDLTPFRLDYIIRRQLNGRGGVLSVYIVVTYK